MIAVIIKNRLENMRKDVFEAMDVRQHRTMLRKDIVKELKVL